MLKIFGVACVMTAAIGYSRYLLEKQMIRRGALQSLVSMAELLAGFIGYERLTMEEAFGRLAGCRGESGLDSLERTVARRMADRLAGGTDASLEAAWCGVFCAEAPKLFLREEELSIVLEMGKGLGGADVETQVRRLRGGAERLEKKLSDAGRELAEKRKLYCFLGVAAGAMTALVLL